MSNSAQQITIVEETRGEVTHLALYGSLAVQAEEQVKVKSDELLRLGKVRVVIDLDGVDFVDSAGIGGLVALFKRARALDGDVKIANISGQPRELFRLLRLDKAFELHASVESAVNAFSPSYPGRAGANEESRRSTVHHIGSDPPILDAGPSLTL